MLAVKARWSESASAGALVDAIDRVETELRLAFPAVHWCFFEPDSKN